jgi:voltage-dependent anion channel protein 2
MSSVSTSAALGLKGGVVVGGDVTYNMSGKTGISSYSVGASYTAGPLFAAVTTANKMASLNLAVMYKVNNGLTLASSTTHSSATPLQVVAVGGLYKASFGDVKAKVGSNGVVSASLIKEIAPKVTLTASGSVSKGDLSTLKYGFGIVM